MRGRVANTNANVMNGRVANTNPNVMRGRAERHNDAVLAVDAFIANDEIDQIEWRLAEHDSFVHLFVCVESNLTHMGSPKPAYVRKALSAGRFRRWMHKLEIITVGEPPPEWLDDTVLDADLRKCERSGWDSILTAGGALHHLHIHGYMGGPEVCASRDEKARP